jgi:hypothetical protein
MRGGVAETARHAHCRWDPFEGHVNLPETLAERIFDFRLGNPQVPQSVHLQVTELDAHDDCEVGCGTRRRR